MKLVIFFDTYIKEDLDLSRPNLGNPGIGGTQFCFILLIANLIELYSDIQIIVLSLNKLNLPDKALNIVVKTFEEALAKSNSENCDFFILKTPMSREYYRLMVNSNVKIICWSHNYFNASIAEEISKRNEIVANVFVSKQMYDFYYDHDIIKKSTYIFNMVPDALGQCVRKPIPYSAVYMGSLIKQKGIIDLLKMWRIIEHRFPEAKLYVLGSGRLYSSDAELGRWGIASSALEREMEYYIIDQKTGCIKENIHFCGIKGQEKYALFLNTSVGIVNPSANTETFGMGIIEMASAMLPVVTRNWNGHPDTAKHGETALLGYTITSMANNVINLFENEQLNITLGENAKKEIARFSPNIITANWYDFIFNLKYYSWKQKVHPISTPYLNNYKFIRYINSIFRFTLRLSFLPAIVDCETFINSFFKKIRK